MTMTAEVTLSDPSSEVIAEPSHVGNTSSPSSPEPESVAPIPPLNVSSFDGSARYRDEFERGAAYLGYSTIHPQQYVIADALNAVKPSGRPLHKTTGICIPRRASKSTSIFMLLVGRCLSRPGYSVAITAQSGLKARQRFLFDLVRPIQRFQMEALENKEVKINQGKGGEYILWPNGSTIQVLPPISSSFRGDAYSAVFIDEGQEFDPEESADLIGAIRPVFDTVPDGQLIIAGTTGKHRSGMLWDVLEQGRDGTAGIVEYAADPDIDIDDIETWEDVLPFVLTAHPGIGTLTDLDTIHDNFNDMSLSSYFREYVGWWPVGVGTAFINFEKWTEEQSEQKATTVKLPKDFVIGLSVHENQTSASLVGAWRDAKGKANLLVLDHRPGVTWLQKRALELARKYKVSIAHDVRGPVTVEVEALDRARPKPKLLKQSWPNISTAAGLLVKEVDTNNIVHWGQKPLDDAVKLARKRYYGEAWAFGRAGKNSDEDITALEAGSYALRSYDARPAKRAPIGDTF